MIDPSNGYKTAVMAAQQRPTVEGELRAMRQGKPPEHFRVFGEALRWLRDRSQLEMIWLLDAGCASAYYYEVCEHYTPKWADYTGIDYNVQAVGMGRVLYPELMLFDANILNMGFSIYRFDAVLTSATINHIKNWKAALLELTRVCRHWLILHRLPLHETETELSETEAYGEVVWKIVFNRRELEGELEQYGFGLIWQENWQDLTTQVWERHKK